MTDEVLDGKAGGDLAERDNASGHGCCEHSAKRAVHLKIFSCFNEIIGGRCRIRTYDPLIKSQLLYQLS